MRIGWMYVARHAAGVAVNCLPSRMHCGNLTIRKVVPRMTTDYSATVS